MRVLHLATTYPLHADDSNATFIQSIAEALSSRGHTIDVVLPWHPELVAQRPGTAVDLHPFRYSPTRRWHPWGYAQALNADRALRSDAYVAAPLAAAASWMKLRSLDQREPYDLMHAHWLLPNGPVVAAARRRGQPMVISCHGSGVFLAERARWARRVARWALRRASVVTACSGDLARRVSRIGGPSAQRVPYGVDLQRFRPLDTAARAAARAQLAERHGVASTAPLVLAVGRLVYKKGFDVLVRAIPEVARAVPGLRILIVGEGPLRGSLRQLASEAGVGEHLVLGGAISHAELPEYYAAADAVAVPSVHGPAGNVDGLPNTLVEALACGAAVAASRVAGIPDVVTHNDNGLLCPEGDPAQLAAALRELLSNGARRQELGARAATLAKREMSWDRAAERFETIYESVLAAGSSDG